MSIYLWHLLIMVLLLFSFLYVVILSSEHTHCNVTLRLFQTVAPAPTLADCWTCHHHQTPMTKSSGQFWSHCMRPLGIIANGLSTFTYLENNVPKQINL